MYRYLDEHGNVDDFITCESALCTARSVARFLREDCGLKQGDRVALVYPPGALLLLPAGSASYSVLCDTRSALSLPDISCALGHGPLRSGLSGVSTQCILMYVCYGQ